MNRASKGQVIGPTTVTVEAVKVREYYQALEVEPTTPIVTGAPAPLAFPVDDLTLVWDVLQIRHESSLHAGQSISARRQLRVGERLDAVTSITDIWDRGALTFALLRTTYTDRHGTDVLVSEMTVVERQASDEEAP